ncbi:unnamed protein product [Adineta ricciae]|nr:unnamed protein product [Adineta ricciae]
MDGDIIIRVSFYINDVHRCIEKLHQEHQNENTTAQVPAVCHDQGISKLDFDYLQQIRGGLLSFNSSLSITKKLRQVSIAYAKLVIVTLNDHIAAVHHNMNNNATAFFYYEETLTIWQASVPPTHSDRATSYHSKKNYCEVLSSYQKVLKIQLTLLLPTHPHLALSYDNIGNH